ERVGGAKVDVQNLTPACAEPHDLELTTPDVLTLEAADTVLTRSGFQPALADALAEIDGPQVVATDAEEDPHLGEDGDQTQHDAAARSDHAHAHDDGHGHLGTDPHFWLDPTRLATPADQVAAALSETDPTHAATYTANAQQLRAELTDLDEEFRDQ